MTKLREPNQIPSIISSVEIITPRIAKGMIERTKEFPQRNSKDGAIKEYANLMKSGKWILNGESIIIGENGNCLDGLHRLKACVLANCSFNTLVVRNMENSVFSSLDRGSTRTLGDVLSSVGVKNYNVVAATIAKIYAILNNRLGIAVDGCTGGANRYARLDPESMQVFIDKNPNFEDFISNSMKIYTKGDRLITPSLFCALVFYASKINQDKAQLYFYNLSVGSELQTHSPAHHVRKRIIQSKKGSEKLQNAALIKLILKGFLMYCSGEKVLSYIQIPDKLPDLKIQLNLFG